MLHNTFPPKSHAAPKLLNATLIQELVTIHEKFLKVYLQVAPEGVLTYGKSTFAKNAATAEQCQELSLTFMATE